MPTFIPSHHMLTSTRVLLLSVSFLFGVLFLFSSTAISDDSNEDLLFGTHKDITCPANYQSISSTETGTVCQKNTYVCDPTNSLQRSQTTSQNRNQFFYAWQCFQYIKGLPLNGQTSCQAIRANTFRNSNCYIIIQHSSKRKRYLLQVVLLKVMKSTDVLSLTHKIINGYQQSIFLSRTPTTRNLSSHHAYPMIHPAAQYKLLPSS